MADVQQAPVSFHSNYGGLWIDRTDFADQLAAHRAAGTIDAAAASEIEHLENKGFVVLPGAASDADLLAFEQAISTAFRIGNARLMCQAHGSQVSQPVRAGMDRKGTRIVDAYAVLPAALALFASPRLVEFMRLIFQEQPMLFQSLSFDVGSGQGFHQDTAYVVVDRPMELLACWIALEDVQPGSGELRYMVGSHRFADFPFGGNKKYWNPDTDGHDVHGQWTRWLVSEGQRRQLSLETFIAKRGDILIWHADLAHGGSPITKPELTRKSLVGHFCPASAIPHYMSYLPQRRTKRSFRDISFCSGHFDISA